MSQRRPYNHQARLANYYRSLLRSNHVAVLCRDQLGTAYMKSVEIAPQGIYKAAQLAEAVETYCVELKAGCNPYHFIGLAWLAIPTEATLTEAQAERVFDAFGAWHKQQEAA